MPRGRLTSCGPTSPPGLPGFRLGSGVARRSQSFREVAVWVPTRLSLRARPPCTTQEPADYVSRPEGERGAKRNRYLNEKPRLGVIGCKTVHRLCSIRTRRQDMRSRSAARPGRRYTAGPALNRVRIAQCRLSCGGWAGGPPHPGRSFSLMFAAVCSPSDWDGISGLAAYLRVDPELCGGEPARSPARANRRVSGRAQRSPPRATTAPPIKDCPPRESPSRGTGEVLRLLRLRKVKEL